MRFILPVLLSVLCCHGQQALLLSGKATVPLAAVASGGITNTTLGLVNWWKFDENTGTTASDSSDSATGTFQGSPAWTNGVINSAISFPGDGLSYLDLSTNTSAGTGAFTFSCLFKGDSTGTLIYDSDGDSSAGFFIFSPNNTSLAVEVVAGGADCIRTADFGNGFSDWTHLTVTWDGTITDFTTIHVYTNAVETTYVNEVNGSGVHLANTTNTRRIGSGASGGSGNNGTFAGLMDDPRIWNRVLSAGEITNMFQWRGEP